jgi:hypothetical protein
LIKTLLVFELPVSGTTTEFKMNDQKGFELSGFPSLKQTEKIVNIFNK